MQDVRYVGQYQFDVSGLDDGDWSEKRSYQFKQSPHDECRFGRPRAGKTYHWTGVGAASSPRSASPRIINILSLFYNCIYYILYRGRIFACADITRYIFTEEKKNGRYLGRYIQRRFRVYTIQYIITVCAKKRDVGTIIII